MKYINHREMAQLTCFVSLLVGHSLWAVSVTSLSIHELTTQAQLVVHGIVLNKTCQRDPDGRIHTRVEVQVKDAWKGIPAGNPIIIVHGGGTLGEERVEVAGQVEYTIGEEVVAFLVLNQRGEGVTVGLAQGKFHVWKDGATAKILVRNPFHGADASAPGSSNRALAAAPLTLAILKARVKGEEK